MRPIDSHRTRLPALPVLPVVLVALLVLGLGHAPLGCTASQLTTNAANIVMLYDVPVGCENLGVVIGRGGGMSGAYSKPSVLRESAENDARNMAAERGATHLLLHPEELAQGDGRGPSEQDTAPAMAHGSGTGSTVTVARNRIQVCARGAARTGRSFDSSRRSFHRRASAYVHLDGAAR